MRLWHFRNRFFIVPEPARGVNEGDSSWGSPVQVTQEQALQEREERGVQAGLVSCCGSRQQGRGELLSLRVFGGRLTGRQDSWGLHTFFN